MRDCATTWKLSFLDKLDITDDSYLIPIKCKASELALNDDQLGWRTTATEAEKEWLCGRTTLNDNAHCIIMRATAKGSSHTTFGQGLRHALLEDIKIGSIMDK